MKYTVLLCGGSSYGADELDNAPILDSLDDVRRYCRAFFDNSWHDAIDGATPCADDVGFWVFKGAYDPDAAEWQRDPYPDWTVSQGPRGGVRFEIA